MIHAIINKKDNQIWYEGIDKADACNQMKPSFMSWIEAGKPMNEFPLYYEALPELSQEDLKNECELNSLENQSNEQ